MRFTIRLNIVITGDTITSGTFTGSFIQMLHKFMCHIKYKRHVHRQFAYPCSSNIYYKRQLYLSWHSHVQVNNVACVISFKRHVYRQLVLPCSRDPCRLCDSNIKRHVYLQLSYPCSRHPCHIRDINIKRHVYRQLTYAC